MPVKAGKIDKGHPYLEIVVSADDKGPGIPCVALIDTGFSGFVSLPLTMAATLGLKPHTTTRYTLANGKQSDPVPLARAFACVDGDTLVAGVISISESDVIVGVEFLRTCGKGLMVFSQGVVVVDEKEFLEGIKVPHPPEQK